MSTVCFKRLSEVMWEHVLCLVHVLHITLVQHSKTQCQPGGSCSCGTGSVRSPLGSFLLA